MLEKNTELWDGIKSQIKTKDFMKIKFNSFDNFPLNKLLRLYNLTAIVRFVFKVNDINYPQFCLDKCLYEL